MSNLTTLRPSPGSQTRKVRLARGRGSWVGGTSGRGMNGQNSRTGTGKRYPTFEGGQTPLFHKKKKKRGFISYKPEEFVIVNLDQIEALALDGVTVVDYAILYERRIIREKGKFLKILGRGEIKTAFTITADAVSASAKVAIEKAGGTVSVSEATVSE